MKRICSLLLCLLICLQGAACALAQETPDAQTHEFERVQTQWIASENANGTLYRHTASGLMLFYLENGAEELAFSIGFITPPKGDGGANHVLEHALLCGSEKYPSRNLMHHLRNTSVASLINATTNDQTTAYLLRTDNEADFYNLVDVYMNAVRFPLLLREENIFRQQGIRWEPSGESASPNGIVYNELRQRSLETGTSMLREVYRGLQAALFAQSTPIYSSGGEVDAILDLTYADVMETYHAYYRPDNALVFLSGNQDLDRTFSLISTYLLDWPAGEGPAAPAYTLRGEAGNFFSPDIPTEGELVDIGFTFSGIPSAEPRSVYARDALLTLAIDHLRAEWPSVFMVSDDTSGYATFSIIISGVPTASADGLLESFQGFLLQELPLLIATEAMAEALSTYEWMLEDGTGWALQSTLKGFASGDPYVLLSKAEDFAYLREHPEFIEGVWQTHLVDTQYRASLSIAQEARPDPAARSFTQAELAELRKEADAFDAWVNAPETAEETASLPRLRIADFAEHSLDYASDTGSREGVSYWFQPDEALQEMTVACAVPHGEDRWLDLSLLTRLLSHQDLGIGAYFIADKDLTQDGYVLPRVYLIPMDTEITMKSLAGTLADPQWITAEGLSAFLAAEAQQVAQYLESPYSLAIERMYSDISPQYRFSGKTLGLIGNGTETYLAYLQALIGEDAEPIAQMLRTLAVSLADRQDMLLYVRGEQKTFDRVLEDIIEAFPRSEESRQRSIRPTDAGSHSTLVVTPQAESTIHYMQVGTFEGTEWTHTGQMDVMARVVQSRYLLPELRNKRGAYGAQILAEDGYLSVGASGASSIDETYEVLLGAADFLRTLDITQEELEAIIIATVHTFDQRHKASDYYAMDADLSGNTRARLAAHREEILKTTIKDVQAFAAFLEEMITQQRIFAYTNPDGAQTTVPFEDILPVGE